ncbi:MAG: ThaI family type II restriction endonuclease [bacterium]
MGRKNYIKLPKPGTNPGGLEITKEALLNLTQKMQ